MPYGTINADLMTTSDGVSSSGLYGFKNRIINGAMVIDQRNAGASVTPTVNPTYTVDRWFAAPAVASKFSVQQSTTAPTGFSYSLKMTSLAATTVGATDFYVMYQAIEGYNSADLGWGTASASTVTLSFWVQSSLTGTFGGSLFNSAASVSYPFNYTISTANTWEQKTVTIAGPTSGTFLTTNGVGFYVGFSLGAGATASGTAGSWSGTFYRSATSAVQVVATNAATFYITGVQLEKGSTATSFDYRPIGTELALCQRYYETGITGSGSRNSDNYGVSAGQYKVTKRTTSPTVTPSSAQGGYYLANENGFVSYQLTGVSTGYFFTYTSSAEL